MGNGKHIPDFDWSVKLSELLKEWDFKKNKIDPKHLSGGSHKKIWWLCSKGHEWESPLRDRVKTGHGCPYCKGNRISAITSLAFISPDLAKEWHPVLNNFPPEEIGSASTRKVWWLCSKGHEWEATPNARYRNKKIIQCPYCSGARPTSENNLAILFPDLKKQWSPRNESKPDDFLVNSDKSIYWICFKGHEWKTSIYHRTHGSQCPYCRGLTLSNEIDSLAFKFPFLACEWNLDRNGSLLPDKFLPYSSKVVWWKCLAKSHEWKKSIAGRTSLNLNCPYCSNKKVCNDNSLLISHPSLASEWNQEKNGKLRPQDVTFGSAKSVWWKCSQGHSWKSSINNRTKSKNSGCPSCCFTHTNLEKFVEGKLGIPKYDKCPLVSLSKKFRPDFQLTDKIYLNVDGLYWHSDIYRHKKYHLELRESFESEGLRLLQFYEDEIRDKWPIVESMINSALGKTPNRIGARECEIKEVSMMTACAFLNDNHLQGEYRFAKYFGLYKDEVLLSLIAIRPIRGIMEISRFCTLKNYLVSGGFSRLLQFVIDKFHPPEIVSFCDLRYFQGKSYEQAGFTHAGTSLGWCWTDNINRYNRLACRAGDGKSEKEKALERGWIRLYGAGHAKYVMKLNCSVAQPVESTTVNRIVAGSNPARAATLL